VNVGIEHLFDLPFDLAADEDEAASGTVVVCGLDKDGVDEFWGEEWEGIEFAEIGFGRGSVWEDQGGRAAAGGTVGMRGTAIGMGIRRLSIVNVILNIVPNLDLVLASVLGCLPG